MIVTLCPSFCNVSLTSRLAKNISAVPDEGAVFYSSTNSVCIERVYFDIGRASDRYGYRVYGVFVFAGCYGMDEAVLLA
jgi:hypothetical protein